MNLNVLKILNIHWKFNLVRISCLSLTSCNDFLDRDPLGQFTEDDSPNALVGGKIFNVYYLMRSYDITSGIPAFMVHMVRSEDSEKGSDAGDGAEEQAALDGHAALPDKENL